MGQMRKFWVRLILCLAVPCVLFLNMAAQVSWRPRTLTIGKANFTLACAPDGQLIVGCRQQTWLDFPQSFQLWNVASGQLQRTLPTSPSAYARVAIAPDARLVAGLDAPGTIKLWNAQSGKLERTLHQAKPEGLVPVHIAFSPDSKTLVESWHDDGNYTPPHMGQVWLWDIQTGTLRHTLNTGGNPVNTFFFTPDGNTLIGSGDYAVQVWDVARGVLLRKLTDKSLLRYGLVLANDGQTLAGVEPSLNGTKPVLLWDIKTGVLQQRLKPPQGYGASDRISFGSSRVDDIVFAPDGRTIATVSNETGLPTPPPGSNTITYSGPGVSVNGAVTLWNSQTGVLQRTFRNNGNPMSVVAFSPDSRLLAVGSDHEGIVWETATGKLWRKLPPQHDPIATLTFTPDGSTLATGSGDQVKLWRIQ